MARSNLQDVERDRKLGIVMRMLETGNLIPMWKIARELGVAPRSVNRYIARLRQTGLDIGGVSGHGGGIVLRKRKRKAA